jgi:predicted nuclease with TOPRIM domain
MKINMKNLNVFRRLDELETANLHLNVMLKSARIEVDALKKTTKEQAQWLASLQTVVMIKKQKAAPKPAPKAVRTKDALNAVAEKKREYARRYYAKKKAAKAAA